MERGCDKSPRQNDPRAVKRGKFVALDHADVLLIGTPDVGLGDRGIVAVGQAARPGEAQSRRLGHGAAAGDDDAVQRNRAGDDDPSRDAADHDRISCRGLGRPDRGSRPGRMPIFMLYETQPPQPKLLVRPYPRSSWQPLPADAGTVASAAMVKARAKTIFVISVLLSVRFARAARPVAGRLMSSAGGASGRPAPDAGCTRGS